MLLVSCVLRMNLLPIYSFDCCVAKWIWNCISEILGIRIGQDFESVARFWLANKRHKVTNTILLLSYGPSGNSGMKFAFRVASGWA